MINTHFALFINVPLKKNSSPQRQENFMTSWTFLPVSYAFCIKILKKKLPTSSICFQHTVKISGSQFVKIDLQGCFHHRSEVQTTQCLSMAVCGGKCCHILTVPPSVSTCAIHTVTPHHSMCEIQNVINENQLVTKCIWDHFILLCFQ